MRRCALILSVAQKARIFSVFTFVDDYFFNQVPSRDLQPKTAQSYPKNVTFNCKIALLDPSTREYNPGGSNDLKSTVAHGQLPRWASLWRPVYFIQMNLQASDVSNRNVGIGLVLMDLNQRIAYLGGQFFKPFMIKWLVILNDVSFTIDESLLNSNVGHCRIDSKASIAELAQFSRFRGLFLHHLEISLSLSSRLRYVSYGGLTF